MADDHCSNIKVCVRVRPENNKERALQHKPVVCVIDKRMLVFDPNYEEEVTYFHGKAVKDPTLRKARDVKFAFDHVFSPMSTNIEVYEQTTKSILTSLLDGYNCSVFAYGATGAGKTFSMLGSAQTPGVIFLSMMDLYNIKEAEHDNKSIEISVSYLEFVESEVAAVNCTAVIACCLESVDLQVIELMMGHLTKYDRLELFIIVYNENIKDLLTPGTGNLPIRDNGKSGVVVQGLTVREPASAEELLQMLERGNKNRTQHPTDANSESSRSHAVFQVFVRVRGSASASLTDNVKCCKLSLIDLAGSERATVTKNRGDRLREGANINKSLLALGNCINALADTKRKGSKHIPYRNSKLTRILKDSLGENCKTVMIAAVSPARASYEDTYNTLSYADRAKKIKVMLKKNELNVNAHIHNYGKVVDDLHAEIAKLREELKTQTEKAFLSERITSSTISPISGDICQFDIDALLTDISIAYGRRREIRDAILELEASKLTCKSFIISKQKLLEGMSAELNSSSQDAAAKISQTISKINRSIQNAVVRYEQLSEQVDEKKREMSSNEAELRRLVIDGKAVDNQHAQEILSLKMKCYHYEQESREQMKLNNHLVKHIKQLNDSHSDVDRVKAMFSQFVETTHQLLTDSGLYMSIDGLRAAYDEVQCYLHSDGHVRFTCTESTASSSTSADIDSLITLPVVSADQSSIAISGEPIMPHLLCDKNLGDATFTQDSDAVLEDGISLPIVTDLSTGSPIGDNSQVRTAASISSPPAMQINKTIEEQNETDAEDSRNVADRDTVGPLDETVTLSSGVCDETFDVDSPVTRELPDNNSVTSSPEATLQTPVKSASTSQAPVKSYSTTYSSDTFFKPVNEVLKLAPILTMTQVVEEGTPSKIRRLDTDVLEAISESTRQTSPVKDDNSLPRDDVSDEPMDLSYVIAATPAAETETPPLMEVNKLMTPSYAEAVKSPAVLPASSTDKHIPGYLRSTQAYSSKRSNNTLKRKLGQENWT